LCSIDSSDVNDNQHLYKSPPIEVVYGKVINSNPGLRILHVYWTYISQFSDIAINHFHHSNVEEWTFWKFNLENTFLLFKTHNIIFSTFWCLISLACFAMLWLWKPTCSLFVFYFVALLPLRTHTTYKLIQKNRAEYIQSECMDRISPFIN